MKRLVMLVIVAICFLTLEPAFAAQRGTPEYEKLKEYKKSQREKEASATAPAEKNFWQREAERSGLAGTAAMFSNPVRLIASRKDTE